MKEEVMGRPTESLRAIQRWSLLAVVLGWTWAGAAGASDTGAPKKGDKRPTNRLAHESSPYLLQHAHNPVDWYPWGSEAFARAKKEGKLVFLSIGYSSCHWCHVMERESFDNPDVAKLMNEWFVCIKVDREERPDVDHIYMTALNVQRIRGGWPLSIFLTAEGKPIIGGTYWPPEDRQVEGEKAPGFKTVLKVIHDWHTEKPQRVQARADDVAAKTIEALATDSRGKALVDLNRALVDAVVEDVKSEYDSVFGGFGSPAGKFRGPKFPVPCYLGLLLHEAGRTKSAELSHMVDQTLEKMAQGGIYDQLGGGFHRYSTERTWTVPHFEKMLYDNAQLAEIYSQAYRRARNSLYRRTVEETLAFVARELTSPEGAFYSALDADSSGVEGLFYVWTDAQIEAALGNKDDAALVKKVYGADGQANFEEKYHILVLSQPLAETARELTMNELQLQIRLVPLRRKLFEARAQRVRPFLDTKILTAWNGQMIAGYAAAGQALREPKYVAAAVRAAEFVLKNLRTKDGRLLRTYGLRDGKTPEARLNAYLDDYAFLTRGLLCLHDATGERRWLDEAKTLTDTMVQYYADSKDGGFFYTSSDHEKLFARSKDQYDGVQPSGNSAAARNLVRLWTRTGDTHYRDLAMQSFKAFAAPLKVNPSGMTAMAEALALYLEAPGSQDKDNLPKDEPAAKSGGAKKSDSVVKITAKAEPAKPGDDGKQVVTITLTIDKGWHLYANPPGMEDLEAVMTKVSVSSKKELQDVKVEYPEGKEINDPAVGKYKVYEDEVKIKATVQRAAGDTGPLEVTVKFQSCNDKQCLLPATRKVTVPEK
jgi:uncharacterized protein YyaL (SSP411 family)